MCIYRSMIHVFYVIYTKDYCMSHPYDCACIPCFHSWKSLRLAAFRGSCNNFKRKWRTLLTREKRSALTKPTIGERITSGTSCFVILPYCLEMYLIYNVETSEVDMHQISANRHFSTGGPRSQHWRDPCGCIESLQFRGVVENRILQGAGWRWKLHLDSLYSPKIAG